MQRWVMTLNAFFLMGVLGACGSSPTLPSPVTSTKVPKAQAPRCGEQLLGSKRPLPVPAGTNVTVEPKRPVMGNDFLGNNPTTTQVWGCDELKSRTDIAAFTYTYVADTRRLALQLQTPSSPVDLKWLGIGFVPDGTPHRQTIVVLDPHRAEQAMVVPTEAGSRFGLIVFAQWVAPSA